MLGGHSFDFAVVDTEVTQKGFLRPEQFFQRDPWKLHTADPFEHVEAPLREKLLALNLRRAEPRGVSSPSPGTAQTRPRCPRRTAS
jgi:hypothetical protein